MTYDRCLASLPDQAPTYKKARSRNGIFNTINMQQNKEYNLDKG